jgi:hypothetical protein
MKRREFITLLGSAATGWPLIARAQQGQRERLVCILEGVSAETPNAKQRHVALLEGLQPLGWTLGRNVRIEVRWGEGDRREPVTAGRQRHRLYDVRIQLVRKMVRTSQGDCAKRDSRGSSPRCWHCCRNRPVRRHSVCSAIGRHRGKPNRLARTGSDRTRHRNIRAEVESRNNLDGGCNRGGQYQFDHRSGRTPQATSGLHSTTLCRIRRIDLLWAEFSGPIQTRGRLR